MRSHARALLPLLFLALLRVAPARGCTLGIPEGQREDCHPDAGASEEACAKLGCAWCPASSPGAPWCFRADAPVCGPVPDAEKRDCHPEEGAGEGACLGRGCCWDVADAPGVPWCFHAASSSCATDAVPDSERVDCHPEQGASEGACAARGCRWCPASTERAPWCFIPNDGSYGYSMRGAPQKTAKGWRVELEKLHQSSLFGGDVANIVLEAEFQTAERLRIKLSDPSESRFEVPLEIPSPDTVPPGLQYEVRFENSPFFHFKVVRIGGGETLWDTSLGGLTFSRQFLQLATRVAPGSSLYGFGEHEHASFRHDAAAFASHGMFARDQSPTPGGNLYGVHNFYMGVGPNFKAHGVLLLNSNAQDVTVAPGPAITYRTIGGVLDFYIFLGPTPESVVQQYTEAVGRPFFPPYWSLGFQLSRWGYGSLDAVRTTVDRLNTFDIPHDVQYGDIDYMERQLDFTYDKQSYAGLPEYVRGLQASGMHYVIILDPCLTKDEPAGSYRPYELGQQMGIWIKNADGTPAVGKVWPPGGSVFPDFTNPDTGKWWVQMCVEFKDVINYDGIWIDMNEPANFGTGQDPGCAANALNKPPYHPRISGDDLAEKTLCPDSLTHLGRHYDTHSLFGWAQHEPTVHASQNATGKRAFVLSRSTFVGSGRWAGHWLGDNFSLWKDMHMSIIGMLEFNLFGIPYIGADICGFIFDTTYELCLRWMQLGAFYPFSRNHNGLGYKEQDPGVFGPEFAATARAALHVRYTLLPFLYSLFYETNTRGGTVVRPLLHEFVTDVQTHGIDRAFLWGPALMVAPVLEEGATSVEVYFPDTRWYNYYTGEEVPASWRRTSPRVAAPLDTIPLFLRGGFVVPTQAPAKTTTHSRVNPLGLIVSLDEKQEARGSLFWDDGDSIGTIESGSYFLAEFEFRANRLTSAVAHNGYAAAAGLAFRDVRVLGLASRPASVTVNGTPLPSADITVLPSGEVTLRISVSITTPLNILFN